MGAILWRFKSSLAHQAESFMEKLPTPYEYERGYIILRVNRFRGLPDKIIIEGTQLLIKSEFHISLVCTKRIAELIDPSQKERIENEIVNLFRSFIEHRNIATFKSTKQLRLVERDERRTLIMMVKLPGLNEFFESLSRQYHQEVPLQPTHITMYTRQPEVGIGILSNEELEHDSKPIEIGDLTAEHISAEST